MKVLSPLNTEHELIVIPRFDVSGDIILELLNEQTDELLIYNLVSLLVDGYLYLAFTQEFDNNSNFRIKITSDDEIVYRGKLFVTDQSYDLQNFKITKDLFTL